jgi:hypothetical protein
MKRIRRSGSSREGRGSVLTQIDEYEVLYSANTFPPRVWLKHGGTYIGQLIFHPDGQALPPDANPGGQPNLHYHLENFENVIDMLRNEKPMYLLYSGSGGGNENGIKTTKEPIGEAEA